MDGKKELLELLLADEARMEMTGGPVLLRARMCGESDEIREVLVEYGARTKLEVLKGEKEEQDTKIIYDTHRAGRAQLSCRKNSMNKQRH